MKQSKTKTPISRTQRELSARQVEEYIERYHPEVKDSEIVISPCGTFASVLKTKKPKKK